MHPRTTGLLATGDGNQATEWNGNAARHGSQDRGELVRGDRREIDQTDTLEADNERGPVYEESRLTYGSLFSGAGGFDLGFDRAGFECLWQVECDKTAASVLRRHWPNVPKHDDVRTFKPTKKQRPDVIIGGFPCQDLSIAGQRAGIEGGERSNLFYELARITERLQPDYLVWENVPGLLSIDNGRDLIRVVRKLAECGYHGGWRTLDARYFGVPQRRRRVFGVFARHDIGIGRVAEILAFSEGVPWHPATGQTAKQEVAGTLGDCSKGGCSLTRMTYIPMTARCLSTSNERIDAETETFVAYRTSGNCGAWETGDTTAALNTATDPNQIVIAHTLTGNVFDASEDGTGRGTPLTPTRYGVRRLTPRECERLQGWPDDHTRYRDDGREIADGPRYRMIGNGVAAPVAEWLARRIKK